MDIEPKSENKLMARTHANFFNPESDNMNEQLANERKLLAGKSQFEKMKFLAELQAQKEKEMQMKFQMERQ